jgi:adenylate kinase
MFNLILFGPPGSGKGTQSENIIAANGLQHLSTGNLLRSEITNVTPLGLKAKTFMDAGQLVPDEVVIGMVDNFMNAHPAAKGFLFDGFPRTTAQCIALDALLQQKGTEINVVLALEVTEEELVKRLLGRGATSGRSDDTDETIIRARIQEYHDKTTAVATYYAQFNKVISVKGEGTVESIYADLKKEIDARI